MSDPPLPPTSRNSALQFDQAEFAQIEPAPTTCEACKQPILDEYYEINGKILCGRCREQIARQLQGGSRWGRFLWAGTCGAVAAAIGSLAYYAVSYFTGYEFGLMAIVLGLFVGGAVRWGSAARGGWFYQLLAVCLTYLAIVSTYIPTILRAMDEATLERATATQAGAGEASTPTPADTRESDLAGGVDPSTPDGSLDAKQLSGGPFILGLAIIVGFAALISPIFAAFNGGILGVVIIAIALWEAWRINKRAPFSIAGPFQLASAGESAPPAS